MDPQDPYHFSPARPDSYGAPQQPPAYGPPQQPPTFGAQSLDFSSGLEIQPQVRRPKRRFNLGWLYVVPGVAALVGVVLWFVAGAVEHDNNPHGVIAHIGGYLVMGSVVLFIVVGFVSAIAGRFNR